MKKSLINKKTLINIIILTFIIVMLFLSTEVYAELPSDMKKAMLSHMDNITFNHIEKVNYPLISQEQVSTGKIQLYAYIAACALLFLFMIILTVITRVSDSKEQNKKVNFNIKWTSVLKIFIIFLLFLGIANNVMIYLKLHNQSIGTLNANPEEFAVIWSTSFFERKEYIIKIASIAMGITMLLKLIEEIEFLVENKKEDEDSNGKKRKPTIKLTILALILIVFLFVSNTTPGVTEINLSVHAAKPIIYLYPEEEQETLVKLENPEKITCSYPKYENEWTVLAKPNGDLVDLETGRNLYALYWEGSRNTDIEINEGFCVRGEDSGEFLEDKLAVLGLTEREAEEFIVYWLPKLEANKYNIIRFETKQEIDNYMPLTIQPEPDTIIRILMDFKASDEYVELKEQSLITPERKGFTAVEWGGTELY